MKASDFLAKHAPTLKPDHLDWLTALKDETMGDVWEGTNDPLILVEIMRCLLNPNYDTALHEYLRDAIEMFGAYCKTELGIRMKTDAVAMMNYYIDGKSNHKSLVHFCFEFHRGVRNLSAGKQEVKSFLDALPIENMEVPDEKEKAALFSMFTGMNWLCSVEETAAVYAAYHVTEHLTRTFNEGKEELSDKLRNYIGNPFA